MMGQAALNDRFITLPEGAKGIPVRWGGNALGRSDSWDQLLKNFLYKTLTSLIIVYIAAADFSRAQLGNKR